MTQLMYMGLKDNFFMITKVLTDSSSLAVPSPTPPPGPRPKPAPRGRPIMIEYIHHAYFNNFQNLRKLKMIFKCFSLSFYYFSVSLQAAYRSRLPGGCVSRQVQLPCHPEILKGHSQVI